MSETEQITHKGIAPALLAAQREMPAVPKDATNPHLHNRFASINAILATALPILNKHGIVLLQMPTQVNGFPALRTRFLHESGEWEEDTMLLALEKDTPQGQGSAITYGRRYSLQGGLGLETEDDDGNSAESAQPRASRASSGGAKPSEKQLTLLRDKMNKVPGGQALVRAALNEHGAAAVSDLDRSVVSDLIDKLMNPGSWTPGEDYGQTDLGSVDPE